MDKWGVSSRTPAHRQGSYPCTSSSALRKTAWSPALLLVGVRTRAVSRSSRRPEGMAGLPIMTAPPFWLIADTCNSEGVEHAISPWSPPEVNG